jgi:MFS family permease
VTIIDKPPGRNRSFLLLWFGQAVSEMGSAITGLVIPLLAVTALNASTLQVGILKSCATVALVFISMPVGVFVDRHTKRPVMIFCDLGRALALASVPFVALVGTLHMSQLYVVSVITGVLRFVFGIAYHAYYPTLLSRAHLTEANGKIAATEAFSRVAGPGLGALLFSVFRASTALLVDVVTFIISAITVLAIRTPEPTPARAGDDGDGSARTSWRREMREGVRLVFADRVLAATALTTLGAVFCLFITEAVFVYFLVHSLHMASGVVGLVYVVGEIGGLIAAVFANRIMKAVGTARIMWVVTLASPAGFLAVIATPTSGVALVSIFMVFSSTRFVLFDVAQYSYRQTVCPPQSLGRMTATIRLALGLAGAVGALIGGWLGGLIGARATLAIAATLLCVAALPVLLSPLMQARNIEDLPAAATAFDDERAEDEAASENVSAADPAAVESNTDVAADSRRG